MYRKNGLHLRLRWCIIGSEAMNGSDAFILLFSECAAVEGAQEQMRHPNREQRPIPAGSFP